MAKKIALANQKGGVRKTTTTANLGYVLSRYLGKRVLLIDADPQKNLTKKFIEDYSSLPTTVTLYETLKYAKPLPISFTRIEGLDIVPSHISLAAIESEIISEFDARVRVRNAITEIEDKYDYILIDCPPSLGLLSINGLAAADKVIIPLSHLGDETEGMSDLLVTFNKVKQHLNPSLAILGIIQTMTDSTSLSTSFTANLKEGYGDLVFKSKIPRSILIPEANDQGLLLFEYNAPKKRKDPIENSFKNFALEVTNRF